MDTTASYSSEPSWSRRCSTETVFSIQGKETDFVRDTSDTDTDTECVGSEDERDVEFEPVTEPEDDGPVSCDSSGGSDNEIITTKVIEVSMRDDVDLVFADSEQTESNGSDSEIDLHDYWHCAQCHARNDNPCYRYCQKCFKVRKNFFPPRPKRKLKRNLLENPSLDPEINTKDGDTVARLNSDNLALLSQDSGIDSLGVTPGSSQDLSPSERVGSSAENEVKSESSLSKSFISRRRRKRRADSADRKNKRMKEDYLDSGSDSDVETVKPLVKMVSDPSLSVHEVDTVQLSKKAIINSLKENLDGKDMCIICFSKPKSGVFVHGRIAHICCCYNCAVKVWAKAKRCPVCNCKVSNVLKAVVM
ncbi:E3 ubiquitin-protein ligase Mdm2-like [Battus philenor]|uniref:E3 ubiquitin-protein ligase Mdm2-like n=1 Tax=Battus philenor TaxID=42288 RepID=UPI0035D07BB0